MSEPGVRLSGSCFQLSTKRCWKGLLKPCKGLVLPFLAATSAAYEIRIAVLNGVEKLLPPEIILLQPLSKIQARTETLVDDQDVPQKGDVKSLEVRNTTIMRVNQ
jgi:hypothetical protein